MPSDRAFNLHGAAGAQYQREWAVFEFEGTSGRSKPQQHSSVYDNEEEEEKPVQGSAVQEAHLSACRGCCRVACLDWGTVRRLPASGGG